MIKIQHKGLRELSKEYLRMAKDPRKGNIPVKLAEKRQYAPKQQDRFWSFLEEKLDTILSGNPLELHEIIGEVEHKFPNEKTRAERGASKLGKSIANVFDYKGFSANTNGGWNAYWLAKQLGVDTCPYCNRLYTHTVTGDLKNITRPQFDHFMNKATYPYLAISFYNLIPSCAVCNSGLKGSIRFSPKTHIHPYLDGFGDLVKFKVEIKECSFFHGNLSAGRVRFESKSTDSEQESKLIERARRNIEAFKLELIYNQHIDYAQEQISRAMVYHSDYLDSLFQQFEGTLFRNREDLARFVSVNYSEDENLSKRPLSKLTKDIAEQFGLWENPFLNY